MEEFGHIVGCCIVSDVGAAASVMRIPGLDPGIDPCIHPIAN